MEIERDPTLPPEGLSPRALRYVADQATRAWPQLAFSDDARVIGEAGTHPAVAVRAQGWQVVMAGAVILAVDRGRDGARADVLYAVALRRDVPVAVAIQTGEG